MSNNNKEINYSSIGAMLCGKPLTEEQKEDVKQLKAEYEEAHDNKVNNSEE